MGLEFFDVDLRWGVPAKRVVDGETRQLLGVCRQWIDRVEPFFICMLGQRYGWVPAAARSRTTTIDWRMRGSLSRRWKSGTPC